MRCRRIAGCKADDGTRRNRPGRLHSISGFGFAVLAAPLFLLFLDPARAIQLIIISTVLSIVVLRGLLPAIAPRLLLRLALGSLVGLPLGLVAFRYADPILVRAAAGAMIFGFAILMAVSRRRSGQPGRDKHWTARPRANDWQASENP
jgi:uncharacterized membrane protein YfcA